MKQKDIALIAIIVIFSGIISLLLSNVLFASPKNRQQEVEVVQTITAEFPKPDSRYFNNQSFDPAQLITVSQNANPNPFNSNVSPQ